MQIHFIPPLLRFASEPMCEDKECRKGTLRVEHSNVSVELFSYGPTELVSSELIRYGGTTTPRYDPMNQAVTIPGAEARAFKLKQKEQIRIINLEGSQVVDAWAFCTQQPDEFMSTEHTRSCLEKLIPSVGDALYSNRRRPILRIVEDTSPGVHDLLLSACDIDRYRLLGVKSYHRNCADNLIEALAEIDVTPPEIPSPFNIFENVSLWLKPVTV